MEDDCNSVQIGFIIQILYEEFGSDAWEDDEVFPCDMNNREDVKEIARNRLRFNRDFYPKRKFRLLEVYCMEVS